MQNDAMQASKYLGMFSKLIRTVMENSGHDRISLTSELEALQLYIEMETLRFKEKLTYTISIDKEVETDFIEIPPLLLQPYVENAIWHGLMNKEEGGKVEISTQLISEKKILKITISDDGIGRKKAGEIKSKKLHKYKSLGMKITADRIALINEVYKTGASVAVDDVININSKVIGTTVTIQIPV
jgi:LytS/YehU family sensor histidine kinase